MKRKQLARIDLSDPEKPKLVYDARSMKEDIKAFKEGERVWVTIERYYRKRTVEQNRVLHWYFNEISDETGMSMEEVKEFFAHKFLTTEVVDGNGEIRCDPETGEVMTRIRSTTELNTVEANEYSEKIRLFSNDFFNLQLPLPNENTELKFNQ